MVHDIGKVILGTACGAGSGRHQFSIQTELGSAVAPGVGKGEPLSAKIGNRESVVNPYMLNPHRGCILCRDLVPYGCNRGGVGK
jgi:hypothetical protein